MGIRIVTALLFSLILLSGCTSYYTRPVNLGPLEARSGHAVMADIRQRALITGTPTKDGHAVTCAEPSPDAMSAISSSVSAALKAKPEQTLEFAQSLTESAAFVGNRTQTIQLLRDGMYRLCEGYMSGGLSEFQYQWMMRRYQRNMVAILAIESLTGTIHAPATTLTTNASASTARSIAELESQLGEVTDKITTLEAQLATLDDGEADKKQDISEAIERHKTTKELLEASIANGQSLIASSNTMAAQQAAPTHSAVTDQKTIKLIADIITKIYEPNDADGLCLEAIKNAEDPSIIAEFCSGYLDIKLQEGATAGEANPTQAQ